MFLHKAPLPPLESHLAANRQEAGKGVPAGDSAAPLPGFFRLPVHVKERAGGSLPPLPNRLPLPTRHQRRKAWLWLPACRPPSPLPSGVLAVPPPPSSDVLQKEKQEGVCVCGGVPFCEMGLIVSSQCGIFVVVLIHFVTY